MNIDVVGRLRPPVRGEGAINLTIEGNRVSARNSTVQFSFKHLYREDTTNYDVFKRSVEPLMELFIAGFNASVIILGESNSGRCHAVAGEKSGLVLLMLDYLFKTIGEDERYMYDSRVRSQHRVHMQMFEVYNEQIRDLMQVPGVQLEFQDLDETPDKGVFVKNAQSKPLSDATDGGAFFRQGWARRTEAITDFGPAKKYSAVLIRLELNLQQADNPIPMKPRFSVVYLPAMEKLVEDSSYAKQREGPSLRRSLIALSSLITSLSNKTHPDRVVNYKESKLTRLLQEELGGNCKTRVLACLKPQPSTDVLSSYLRMCGQLSNVKNYPILNDGFAQQLVTQYRAKIMHHEFTLGASNTLHDTSYIDLTEELKRIKTENLQLHDKNERLHHKLDSLQGKFGLMATNKADLSSQLLNTEEEKLKVSKTLLEMQIENNKLKEDYEATKFEQTNKILQLQNDLVEASLERDKQTKAAKSAKERLSELERDRKDLADEYVILKSNYLAMSKAHEREVGRNEELSVELLSLVNAKATLMRQMENLKLASGIPEDPDAEIDRVRNMVSRLNTLRAPEDEGRANRERVEKELFGDQRRFQAEMDNIKNQYDQGQELLHEKLVDLRKYLQEARDIARERQRRISELNAQLISVKSDRDAFKSQFNRAQHKLKDVSEEYKIRLVKYLEDVAEFVDNTNSTMGQKTNTQMQKYVQDMVGDLNKAHKTREEQLSDAALGFKKRLDKTAVEHEKLLVAYRDLRSQVETLRTDEIDLGPEEAALALSDDKLVTSQQREIFRLREELQQVKHELETAQFQTNVSGGRSAKDLKSNLDTENWSSLRKQLREFTISTQQELEDERAALLTQNAILSEQVEELQNYIDAHLVRYRDEVSRLRDENRLVPDLISPHRPK